MISDQGAKIAKTYNVYTFEVIPHLNALKTRSAFPSSFLVDKTMTVLWRYLSIGKDRPSVETLLQAIDSGNK